MSTLVAALKSISALFLWEQYWVLFLTYWSNRNEIAPSSDRLLLVTSQTHPLSPELWQFLISSTDKWHGRPIVLVLHTVIMATYVTHTTRFGADFHGHKVVGKRKAATSPTYACFSQTVKNHCRRTQGGEEGWVLADYHKEGWLDGD